MLVTSFKLPVMLFLTHGSCATDVIKTWKKLFPIDVYLHQKDIHHPWLMQLPDILFDSNFCIDNRIEIIHTLGHSHGSICLLDKASKFLFSGDTICGNKSQKIIDFTLSKKAKYEDFNQ